MTKQNIFKKIGVFLLDFFELYLPTFTFIILFSVFILQIFFRYFLKHPLTWAYEISVFAFIWTVLLSACYARRFGEHVCFGLVYDLVSPRKQAIFRIIGNILIFVAFSIAIYPSYEYIKFYHIQTSAVFKIPFDYVYSPFVVFLAIIIGRSLYDIIKDIKLLKSGSYQVENSATCKGDI